ncbi:AAA family ATPase [Rhodoblastus sp.]|uniref:AAA family ATPase n=1 Tax=Rhodoblastus sp. TaxID=1962975 RepID=UPI003FD782DE
MTRHSVLLSGPPGNGRTSYAEAIAEGRGLPLSRTNCGRSPHAEQRNRSASAGTAPPLGRFVTSTLASRSQRQRTITYDRRLG